MILKDIQYAELQLVIEYCYKGKVRHQNETNCYKDKVLKTGQKTQMKYDMLTKVQSNIEKVSLRQEQLESLLAAASALGVVGLLQGAPNKGFIAWFSWFWKLKMARLRYLLDFCLLSLVMFSLAGLVMKLISGNTFDFEAKKQSASQEEHQRLPLQAPQL